MGLQSRCRLGLKSPEGFIGSGDLLLSSLTWLLAGSLSSSSHEPLSRAVECPQKMVVVFSRANELRESKEEARCL